MKNKTPLIIIAAVVVLGTIGAVVYGASRSNSPAHVHSNTSEAHDDSDTSDTKDAVASSAVAIEGFKFTPATITVKKGTTVTWTNNDSVKHNVVGDNLDDLNGPLIEKGQTYTYTFKTVGTFTYYCSPHPYMKGTVIVTE